MAEEVREEQRGQEQEKEAAGQRKEGGAKQRLQEKRFFLRDCWEGLRCGLAPMLGKEMRGRTRGWRSPVLLTVYLGVLSAFVLLFLWLNLERLSMIRPQVGLSLYSLFIFSLIMLISFIAPAVAAGAISGERERRTYDLLLVTKASIPGIVLGKWLASVVYLMFLAVAALPVFAVVFLYGGVPPAILGLAFVVCLAAGLGYGAMGLALSALTRRSQAAMIISLVLVFFFIFGIPVITGIIMASNPPGPSPQPLGQPGAAIAGPPWYVFLSPLTAFTSVLPGSGEYDRNWGIPLISELMNMLLNRMVQPEMMVYAYKMGYASGYMSSGYPGGVEAKPAGLAAWAPWARFTLYQGILIPVSLAAAVLAIAPRKPWPFRRAGKKNN
ncbi:MAG: ABC transporter permease subunit [Bacillota bacterium]